MNDVDEFCTMACYEAFFLDPKFRGSLGRDGKRHGGLGLDKILYILGYDFYNGGGGMTPKEIYSCMKDDNISIGEVRKYLRAKSSLVNLEFDANDGVFFLDHDLQKEIDNKLEDVLNPSFLD